jgi:hypothetical protein
MLEDAGKISSELQIKLIEFFLLYKSKELYEKSIRITCKLMKLQPELDHIFSLKH